MNRFTEMIPAEDRAVLEAAFEEHKEQLPGKTAEQFMEDIVWRVYTEICCAGAPITTPCPRAGIALQKWFSDEIHYAS